MWNTGSAEVAANALKNKTTDECLTARNVELNRLSFTPFYWHRWKSEVHQMQERRPQKREELVQGNLAAGEFKARWPELLHIDGKGKHTLSFPRVHFYSEQFQCAAVQSKTLKSWTTPPTPQPLSQNHPEKNILHHHSNSIVAFDSMTSAAVLFMFLTTQYFFISSTFPRLLTQIDTWKPVL